MKSRGSQISLKPACMTINNILDEMTQKETIDDLSIERLSEIINTPQSVHDTKIEYVYSEQETVERLIKMILKISPEQTIEFVQNTLLNGENPFSPYIQNYRSHSGKKFSTLLLLSYIYPTETNKEFCDYFSNHIQNIFSMSSIRTNLNSRKKKSLLVLRDTFDKQVTLDFLFQKNENTIANYELISLYMPLWMQFRGYLRYCQSILN